jgi:hypothetical protein
MRRFIAMGARDFFHAIGAAISKRSVSSRSASPHVVGFIGFDLPDGLDLV